MPAHSRQSGISIHAELAAACPSPEALDGQRVLRRKGKETHMAASLSASEVGLAADNPNMGGQWID
jgi:hypothetical protein